VDNAEPIVLWNTGVLFDSRCFSTTDDASVYAIAQMRVYGP
jgi:hypothetical protein